MHATFRGYRKELPTAVISQFGSPMSILVHIFMSRFQL